ncbi:hypothetical protein DL546_004422 [Coniochaeta pulveracea]|uniref:Uncharacterized protein n=1 Tax=Coniochaeta pulveracea TaxID=177199 RepID=A0A420Y1D9_9PEZI|nr:hypothetical protein DL546_004422 [Coniochaeta pulveracea]
MTSQNVNFASPHAASQMINNIENKVAGKLTAFTDDVNDTVSDLAAGRCTVIAALRVLGAIQAELQEMNQAIEVNRATVLNLLCGLSTSELEAIQGSVVIRQLFDEQFPGTLPVLVARQAQA